MKNSGRLALIAACAATAGLVPAIGASAHTKTYESTVTIKERPGSLYTGRVTSDLGACFKNRTVQLFNSDDNLIATTETNRQGRYRYQFIGQRYYARVRQTTFIGDQHEHTCKADKSPTTEANY